MNGLFLYHYINFFFYIHGYTFSFYDYALSPALEVLYFVCSYPEIIPTVWVGLGTVYSRKYFFGIITWTYCVTIIRFVVLVLSLQFISASFWVILWFFMTVMMIFDSEEVREFQRVIAGEIQRNELRYNDFWEYLRYEHTIGIFTGIRHDRRMESVLSVVSTRFYNETIEIFYFIGARNFRARNQHIRMECSICLCEFEYDEVLTKSFRCCHLFHKVCCEEWLRRSVAGTCPLCRSDRL